MSLVNQIYPHAPINEEELYNRLKNVWYEQGDLCITKKQQERMDLTDQMTIETLGIRLYGRRKK